jgi:hypothetical protein
MASVAETYTTLPTYESLVEMLKIYINRKDQDTLDAMPFFINAAEKTILRMLRIPATEKMVSFPVSSITEGYVELPFDYVEMRFMWTDGEDSNGTLQRVPFDQIMRGAPISALASTAFNGGGGNSVPNNDSFVLEGDGDYNTGYWAVNGNRLYICPAADIAEVKMTYYYDVPEISPTTQSNPLLTLLPDSFLYLAVAEGWKFLMEPEKAAMWEQFAMTRLQQVQMQADNAEFSGSPLTITPI